MLIEEMFPSLRPGMLVLADRHVYSFRRWRKAILTGGDLLWRVPANLVLCPAQRLPDDPFIAEITPPKSSAHQPFRLWVATLHYERWDIEGFLKQVRVSSSSRRRSSGQKSPDGVRQEFWAHLAVRRGASRSPNSMITLAPAQHDQTPPPTGQDHLTDRHWVSRGFHGGIRASRR